MTFSRGERMLYVSCRRDARVNTLRIDATGDLSPAGELTTPSGACPTTSNPGARSRTAWWCHEAVSMSVAPQAAETREPGSTLTGCWIGPIPVDDAEWRARQLPKVGDPESLKFRWNRSFLRIVHKGFDRRDKVIQQCVRTIIAIRPALLQAALPDTHKIALRTGGDLDRYGDRHHSV